MMRKIIFGITYVISINVYQSQSFGIQSLPPTPNAASIEKFVSHNVDYSTGVPDISVPLYHISSGDVNVPVSLKYNSAGIKVSENASNVGLGWSLASGGSVSRSMLGLPDDYYNPGQFMGGFIYTQTPVTYIATANSYDALTIQQNISENRYDAQADIFYYSLPGSSGKISYNQITQKFVEMPMSNNKITPLYDTVTQLIIGWEILDTSGIKYIFGADENSRELSVNNGITMSGGTGPLTLLPNSSIPNHYTNWHLSQIIDTKGNIVNFEYDIVSQVKQVSKGMVTKSRQKISPTLYTSRNYNEKYLKKISFQTGYVMFNPDTSIRLDLQNSKRIADMQVFSNSGQLIKKVKFNHSYFIGDAGSSGDSFAYISLPASNNTHRLKLDSVEESYSDPGQQKKEYRFEYDDNVLPKKSSNSMDYWGGYNGEPNVNLFPRMFFQYGINLLEDGHAERSVNAEFATAGILKKIIYPTRGSTEYIFEPNTASSFDYLPQNDTAQLSIVNIRSSYKKRTYNVNKSNSTFYSNGIRRWEYTFTIDHKLHSDLQLGNFQITGCPVNTVDPGGNYIGECNYIYSLLDAADQPLDIASGKWLNLPVGTYKIKVQYMGLPEPNYESQSDFHLSLTIKEDPQPLIKRVGGLRIKEIRSYSNDDVLKYKKYFDYNYFNDQLTELSSGYTFLPTYGMYGHITAAVGDVIYSDNVYSFLPVGNTVYSKITEYSEDFDNHSVIKTLHTYQQNGNTAASPTVNYGCQNCLYVHNMENTDNSWERKKKNGEIIYKSNFNGLDEEVKKISYIYDYSHVNQTRQFFPAGFYSLQFPITGSSTNGVISGFYYNYTNNVRLLSKKDKEIFNTDFVNTEENFSYGNNIFNPIKKSAVLHDGTVSETSYQYAYEKGNQLLISKNMIDIPLETTITQTKNGVTKTLSTSEIVFPVYQSEANIKTSGLPLPYEMKSTDIFGVNSVEATYDKYDSKGNILQYTTKEGTPVSIIWGYNRTQPVAKIEGAVYNNIQNNSLITAIINASNSDAANPATESSLITALDNLRNDVNFKDFQMATYTYDPLIGVTSITPPSGIREIYKYDPANRLEKIVDEEGRILKEFKYNYKP
ncbi:SpvB/TcaC N-terminal domain-containing protein [Chryseobacterium sp. GP-SGM7]|uniref:SpvB/TcaC N-terminal domain-containing protein n=1 Tax=Chryseobacterium sp. GP-SGM7 TaxID=3411323 RepID=UPI003B94DAFB